MRKVTDELAVAEQISVTDIPKIAAAGFCAIICNRPDGESPGQPTSAAIAAAAAQHGLAFHNIPIVSGRMTRQDVDAFGAALASAEGPVLAYCRSGTRSITLWSLSQMGARPADDIVRLAAGAGYDMSGVVR